MIETAVRIATRVGDEVELRLDRQGVGGYVWTVATPPSGVTISAEPERSFGGAVGGGAELVYRLRADRPGIHEVTCELSRPWGERDLAERRTFTIAVDPI